MTTTAFGQILRLATLGVGVAIVSGCGSGGSNTIPGEHVAKAAHSTKAAFTIKWTNATASAAVRRKDSISPSAQSVTVLVNGTLNTEANRTAGPSQSIALDVPVGTDTFTFNVYDGLNAQGNIIGSATVTKLIVDGAANVVSAAIQTACTATNVAFANDDPLTYTTYATPPGQLARSLSSIVVAGTGSATLIIGPEDVDGNVIIAGTGGTVQYAITGSARVTPIDGAHISLTPLSGFRTTTPDTLTVGAPTCPTTTVAVQHSPAILFENTGYSVFTFDWYGNRLGAGGGYPNLGDTLIGYDTVMKKVIAYNKTSGQVTAYALDWTSSTPLFVVTSNALVSWSNALHSVFGAYPSSGSTAYFTYNTGHIVNYPGTTPGTPNAVSASTFTYQSRAFVQAGGQIFNLAISPSSASIAASGPAAYTSTSIAADDRDAILYTADPGSLVSQYSYNISPPYSASFGLSGTAAIVGTDTDSDDLYAILQTGAVQGSSYSGVLFLDGGAIGTGAAITVISTNEQ